jgi:hypothetical protein
MVRQTGWLTATLLVTAAPGCGSNAGQDRPPAFARPVHTTESSSSRATTVPPPEGSSTRPPGGRGRGDEEPHAAKPQVSEARSAAKAFFSSYVAFLYGRLPPSRVASVNPSVQRQLEHGHATPTPAERASRPRVARVTLTSAGPPVSAIATAFVAVGHAEESRLIATLEPRRGKWLVVAIGG